MNYKTILVGLVVLFVVNFAYSQETDWQLKRETDGFKIYIRNIAETGIKELKITTQFETSLNSIVALLNDVPANTDWVYTNEVAKITEQIAPNDSHNRRFFRPALSLESVNFNARLPL